MFILGVTGSISSGKTTVAKIMASNKYPIFFADRVVAQIYKDKKFLNKLFKLFKFKSKKKIKSQIKQIIKKDKKKFRKLEFLIHPEVRKKMKIFLKKKHKILILEIPLLVENRLNKYFDKIIFVGAKKKLRLKRYLNRGSSKKMFNLLDKRQISPSKKIQVSDHVINNNSNLMNLKKNVKKIIKIYE